MSWFTDLFKPKDIEGFEPFKVKIPAITLHIYPDSNMFPYKEYRDKKAYVYPDGNIFIVGEKQEGGVDFQDIVGGHELQHLANWADSRVIHPHKDRE